MPRSADPNRQRQHTSSSRYTGKKGIVLFGKTTPLNSRILGLHLDAQQTSTLNVPHCPTAYPIPRPCVNCTSLRESDADGFAKLYGIPASQKPNLSSEPASLSLLYRVKPARSEAEYQTSAGNRNQIVGAPHTYFWELGCKDLPSRVCRLQWHQDSSGAHPIQLHNVMQAFITAQALAAACLST